MCVVDMALAKQRPLTGEATESDDESDAEDSLSLDSSPFASPRQLRTHALVCSASAAELASMTDDDSNGQCSALLTVFTVRRLCIARTMPWQDVCKFVHHTPVFCRNG